jgi:RHS repeat-associated protein
VVPFVGANHTTGGSKVVKMNQTYKIGPAKSLKVFPGDKVDIEVWEYHEGASGFGTTATSSAALTTLVANVFGGVSGGMGESGKIFSGVNNAVTQFATNSNQGDLRPAAYLNYILFDLNYKVLDVGAQLAPATTFTKQKLSFPTLNIKEPGILFTYLSYDDDSNNWVYFDDFKVTYTPTNVVQYNEYYPFGMQTANSWTRIGTKNNFLYNGGSEINANSGLYETFFRGYDGALGRFHQVDPMADITGSLTPYQFAYNNPIQMNDPSGALTREGDWETYRGPWSIPYVDGGFGRYYGQPLYRYDPSDYGIDMSMYQAGRWVDRAYIDEADGLTVTTDFVPLDHKKNNQGYNNVLFEYDYDYNGTNLPATPTEEGHLGVTHINKIKSSYLKNARGGYDFKIVITVETSKAFLGSVFSNKNPGLYLEVLAHEFRHGAQLESAFSNVLMNEGQSMISLGGLGDEYANAMFNSMIDGTTFQMNYLFGSGEQIEQDANNGSVQYLPNDYLMQYNNQQKKIEW